MIYNPVISFNLRCQSGICSSSSMDMSDLPEIYTRALGLCPRARVYISGKSQVPIFN